jgi:hypothetical protein
LGETIQFRAVGNLKGKGEQQQKEKENQNVQHDVSGTNGLHHRHHHWPNHRGGVELSEMPNKTDIIEKSQSNIDKNPSD